MVNSALTVRITVTELDRAQLQQLFELLGDQLMERQGGGSSLLDHSVSIDLGKGDIEISVTTSANTEREAQVLADFYIDDVLTSAGGVYAPVAEQQRRTDSVSRAPEFGVEVVGRELEVV